MQLFSIIFSGFLLIASATPAHAEFLISSAILEFTSDGPRQQDIEIVSRSKTSDYIVSEISEIINPGAPDEKRNLITDPESSGLLVTPDKTVLAAGSRKLLRFVLLRDPDNQEHIYRVAIKPVIKGISGTNTIGLKVLVGYEALVIVRPSTITPSFTATRNGRTVHIVNNGNSNVLFEHGSQCPESEKCALPSVVRVYPNQQASVELPLDRPVTYAVWDGVSHTTQKIE